MFFKTYFSPYLNFLFFIYYFYFGFHLFYYFDCFGFLSMFPGFRVSWVGSGWFRVVPGGPSRFRQVPAGSGWISFFTDTEKLQNMFEKGFDRTKIAPGAKVFRNKQFRDTSLSYVILATVQI